MNDVCRELEPVLAGFALGALDPGDLEKVREHLGSCPDCRAILADYQGVVEGLMLSPLPVRPPARLRKNLAAATRPDRADEGRGWSRAGWRIPAWAGLAALVILVGVNGLVLGQTSRLLSAQQRRLDQLLQDQATLSENLQANQTATALITYPNSAVVQVEGDSAYGTFVYDPGLRVAVLYAWGLDRLPSDKTYQAWLTDNSGDRTDAGVFQVSEGTRFTLFVVSASSPLSEFSGMGVTIEPAGGSAGPTGPRVLAADF
jgi:anti-sigma-K factor RskA